MKSTVRPSVFEQERNKKSRSCFSGKRTNRQFLDVSSSNGDEPIWILLTPLLVRLVSLRASFQYILILTRANLHWLAEHISPSHANMYAFGFTHFCSVSFSFLFFVHLLLFFFICLFRFHLNWQFFFHFISSTMYNRRFSYYTYEVKVSICYQTQRKHHHTIVSIGKKTTYRIKCKHTHLFPFFIICTPSFSVAVPRSVRCACCARSRAFTYGCSMHAILGFCTRTHKSQFLFPVCHSLGGPRVFFSIYLTKYYYRIKFISIQWFVVVRCSHLRFYGLSAVFDKTSEQTTRSWGRELCVFLSCHSCWNVVTLRSHQFRHIIRFIRSPFIRLFSLQCHPAHSTLHYYLEALQITYLLRRFYRALARSLAQPLPRCHTRAYINTQTSLTVQSIHRKYQSEEIGITA